MLHSHSLLLSIWGRVKRLSHIQHAVRHLLVLCSAWSSTRQQNTANGIRVLRGLKISHIFKVRFNFSGFCAEAKVVTRTVKIPNSLRSMSSGSCPCSNRTQPDDLSTFFFLAIRMRQQVQHGPSKFSTPLKDACLLRGEIIPGPFYPSHSAWIWCC